MLLQIVMVFVVLLAIVALMSVGVMFGRKPIQGSCGGVGAALGQTDYECEFCGGDPDKCDTVQGSNEASRSGLAYDAARDESSDRR